MTGEMHHKELGRVVVTLRRNSRHITARWKDGLVSLNVPHDVCLPDIHRILDDLAPKLLAARPEVFYRDGQRMQFPHAGFVIRRQTFAPSRILGTASLPLSAVEVGSDWNFDDPSTSRAVSDMLCKVAYRIAPQTLLPRAREIADSIGRHPAGWTVSRGHRVLGQCSYKGVISLSYVLLFLPADLCDYVICHELAHLSEMNHSPRFHALLDSYLGGREAELVARLHSYRWPVLRK